jgi:Concanavalin A-like lectin/glucanases superfamily
LDQLERRFNYQKADVKIKLSSLLIAMTLLAGIYPAAAQLGVASSTSNRTVLFWPASSTNDILQSTTNLATPNWVNVCSCAAMTALVVTNTSPAMFFRLVDPPAPAYQEITNNLAVWYPLEGDVNDHWGSDNATANMTPMWIEPNGQLGAINTALFLTGPQGLTANDNVLPMGNSPRTFSFWLYSTSLPPPGGNVALLFEYGTSTYDQVMRAYLANVSGQMYVEIYISGNNTISFPFNAPVNQWFQLGIEINSGQTVSLEENGVYLTDDSQTISTLNTAPGGVFNIGCWDNVNYIYGGLADFRVYNTALSQPQLMTNFLAVYTNTTVLPQLLYLKMQEDIDANPPYSYNNWPARLADSSSLDNTNVIDYDPTSTDGTTWVPGPNNVTNSALHFHGVYPSYIDTHDATHFAFTNQSYSINFWTKPQTASGIFLSCGINNQSGWAVNENGIYNAYFYTYSNGVSSAIGGGNLSVQNSSWNDICITVSNGTNVCEYWNGGLEYAGPVNLPLTSGTNTLWIGQQNLGGGSSTYLDGDLWEPQIWNTTLSPNDVSKLYYQQMNGTPWP